MSQARLSVVVPTFNRRSILQRTIPALLKQRDVGAEFEVIVVVDGSTDGTLALLNEMGSAPRLRIIAQKNRGLAAARNRGAAAARGEIILFLDDDMMAGPDLAAVHVAEHGTASDMVVLGALGLAEGLRRSFLKEGVEAWSRDMERRLSAPGYRLRFDDWSFGHASIGRGLFLGLDPIIGHANAAIVVVAIRLVQTLVEVILAGFGMLILRSSGTEVPQQLT